MPKTKEGYILNAVTEDTRSLEKKQQDYAHEERELPPCSSDPFGNNQINDSQYIYEDQKGTSSCVAHGVGLGLQIERHNDTGQYILVSKILPYRLRSNFPGPGSFPVEIAGIYAKYGSPLKTTLPTPDTENEANSVKITNQMYTEGDIFKGKEYYTVQQMNDIDTLAQIAQSGHGVPICLFATYDEWKVAWPTVKNENLKIQDAVVRHEVCILPNSGFMKDGNKYLTIQDSAWFGGLKIRHLPEKFIANRIYNALYWDTVTLLGTGERPKYTFTKVLRYGTRSTEVKMMQKLLISEGFLPSDCATGFFAGRTLAGVRSFQNKYAENILKPLGLDEPTNIWGSMCIAQANKLCS
jgi:hypothetical protein